MGLMFNEGHLICQDHYKCEFDKCKHFEWHKERSSCKPRKCNKTGDYVRCSQAVREK